MKERPILFSGEMVRAILDGRKTQTRRVCKLRGNWDIEFRGCGGVDGPDWNNPSCWGFGDADGNNWGLRGDELSLEIPCPYGQPGDQLWVRETFSDVNNCGAPGLLYRADRYLKDLMEVDEYLEEDGSMNYEHPHIKKYLWSVWFADVDSEGGWRPSIFMPRWASRIQLEITNVRVERLQDISEEDAKAEGIHGEAGPGMTCANWFSILWDSINADKHPWESNPWVWCISFRRI